MNRTIIAAATMAAALSATALASADAAPAHHSHATAKGSAFTITASVNKDEPLQGSAVKIRGSVKPAAPGTKVTLELRYLDQKKWKKVATDTLSASSGFKFKDKVSTVRTRKYRVVKPADGHHALARSKAVTVTVFGWRDLTSLAPANATNFGEVDSVTINGVTYPASLRSFVAYMSPGTSGNIDYNLNRDCKTFRATVGLEDSSPAAATTQIQLATDGTSRYSGSFGLTQSAPVTLDVTKVFRISVSQTNTGSGVAAVGSPQVLCSF